MLRLASLLRANAAKATLLVLLSVVLISCESISYYSQAARGQLAIVFGREDIQRLLQQQDLPPELAERFEVALEIREYAERELGLPVGEHYSTYVDVQREHVVWNVFAAPEFSIDALTWCYPIAGCVAYRGYFSEESALRYAAQLEDQGFDVYTGGVDAYSTLGWFEDSLLSTVLNRPDHQLAGLIFHELAHQLVYLPGDTTFNESFATAVEREGVRRWLSRHNESASIEAESAFYEREEQFVELVSDYRQRFGALYQEDISAQSMRSQKSQLQSELRGDYETLKENWQGYGGFDSWFARSLNNAQLFTVASYNDLLPFFSQLFLEAGEDFPAFYEEVSQLAQLPEDQRAQRLLEVD